MNIPVRRVLFLTASLACFLGGPVQAANECNKSNGHFKNDCPVQDELDPMCDVCKDEASCYKYDDGDPGPTSAPLARKKLVCAACRALCPNTPKAAARKKKLMSTTSPKAETLGGGCSYPPCSGTTAPRSGAKMGETAPKEPVKEPAPPATPQK